VATLGGVLLAYVQIAPTFIVIRYLCVQFATAVDELVCDKQDATELKKTVEAHRMLLKQRVSDEAELTAIDNNEGDNNTRKGEEAEVLEVDTDKQMTGVLKLCNATIKVFSVVIGAVVFCSPMWFAVCW
jgi:hypothetical protein